ncbi:MAG: symmetrical bis(5'-nucleosyl)-tetraphosphatase [Magnetococcales bacterium]|nr:symmetrical bis(5'-nucleosyl)-tetraphosphatase [Magnetococcales bacterium]
MGFQLGLVGLESVTVALYAIGDVHGCLKPLRALLDKIKFHPGRDRLLFVGDLINRGPDTLGVLRFVQDLGDAATALMGNHEAWALGGLHGLETPVFQAYAKELRDAPDRDTLTRFIQTFPLSWHDTELNAFAVHAGLVPGWSQQTASQHARELERLFAEGKRIPELFRGMFPILPERDNGSKALSQHRFDISVMTRIRLCHPDGRPMWPANVRKVREEQGENPYLLPPSADPQFKPWYEMRQDRDESRMIYGHWAVARMTIRNNSFGLDDGCVYGGSLVAMRLDHPDWPIFRVPCPQYVVPGK